MTAELNAINSLVGNVRKDVKQHKLRISKKTKNKLNNIGKKDEDKTKQNNKKESSVSTKEQEPTKVQKESFNKTEESTQKGRAYQPMLPGMRGTVERVKPTKTEGPKVTKAEPSNYTQLAFPGMSVSSIKNPTSKESKEDKVVVGGSDGVDWASMPPVDLTRIDTPMRGRQFGA